MTALGLARVAAILLPACLPLSALDGGERGERDPALSPCDVQWDRGRRPQARECYRKLLESSDPSLRAEAWWALGDVKQANDVFRAALAADESDPDVRVRWGYLFIQTHQESEALKLFNEALKLDEDHMAAKLGTASVMGRRFEKQAVAIIDAAIEAEPEQTLGYLMRARLQLEQGDSAEAEKTLGTALEKAESLGRSPLEAYALLAALDMQRGVEDSAWIRKALEHNPRYGELFAETAHFFVITRRYREAVEQLERAVEVDPALWSAHADLGVNLLRANREEEGRRHLEIAYEGDPFSAQTVNTLRLIDSFDQFRLFSSKDLLRLEASGDAAAAFDAPEVRVRLHKKEAALLKLYAMDLAEQSVAVFKKKYGFTPEKSIYVELYPDHDDFAVRTMGLPGVGLLGVTFGYLVAMDSPSGRDPGTFHWGTTLWHEMAHVFTLEATNHLVPRWFSEGISMYEEWEARPHWGERITPDFIGAFDEGKLLPVAELDDGFLRPSYDSQIAVSYFQAGLVCSMIDREWGSEKLVEMLHAFADSKATTASVVENVLGVAPETFDERFQEFLRERLGAMAEKKALEKWRKALKPLLALAREKDWDKVIELAPEVRDLYPEYVQAGSPYTLLARAYEEKGEREEAVASLETYFHIGGRQPEQLRKLADWLHEAGRRADAIEVLEELIWVWPMDEELHRDLGDWLRAEGRDRDAVREYEAWLAMDPLDKAGVHYRLAETYHTMNDSKESASKTSDSKRMRKHLLLALEAAPGYRPAQKLLLEVMGK